MSDIDAEELQAQGQALREEIQDRLETAGVTVIEARISHLAYAPEIANAMLRRQQASAIIAARQLIVKGAVGMVEQMPVDEVTTRHLEHRQRGGVRRVHDALGVDEQDGLGQLVEQHAHRMHS